MPRPLARLTRSCGIADRVAQGQSVPIGETGNGETGVERGHQGISNRPGDEPERKHGEGERDRPQGEDVEELPLTEAVRPLGSPRPGDNTM